MKERRHWFRSDVKNKTMEVEVTRSWQRPAPMYRFVSGVHELRPHKGQGIVAGRFRSILPSSIHTSEISGTSAIPAL